MIKITDLNKIDFSIPFLISSVEFWKYEQKSITKKYKTRLQYTYPVVMFLPDDFSLDIEKILNFN